MTYSYKFVSGSNVPDDINQLIENSKIIYPDIKKYFILYNNDEIDVHYNEETNNYQVEMKDIEDSSKFYRRNYDKNKIIFIWYYINTELLKGQLTIYDKFEKDKKDWIITYHPEEGNWISLMIDDTENKIIGKYSGSTNIDKIGRTYNIFSSIVIQEEYRGKGLCTNFVEYTYQQVSEKLNVKYFLISISAKDPVKACYCYIKASLNLHFNVYINNKQLTDLNTCTIFKEQPNSKVILVVNGQLDDIMIDESISPTHIRNISFFYF